MVGPYFLEYKTAINVILLDYKRSFTATELYNTYMYLIITGMDFATLTSRCPLQELKNNVIIFFQVGYNTLVEYFRSICEKCVYNE